jgi:ubiquinone/menaquinone biosynthesis C-methylase UbiE
MAFDQENATAEELWSHYMEKYENPNPIAKYLTNRFFSTLGELLRQLPQSARVLEIGCGPGESTPRIQSLIGTRYLESSEFDRRLVDLLLSNGFPFTLNQESVCDLQRAADEFDCILLLEVLEHVDDFQSALSEIFRVASKSVIISVPNEPIWRIVNVLRGKYLPELGNTPGHINHWSSSKIVSLVSNFGRVTEVRKPFPWTMIKAEPNL